MVAGLLAQCPEIINITPLLKKYLTINFYRDNFKEMQAVAIFYFNIGAIKFRKFNFQCPITIEVIKGV